MRSIILLYFTSFIYSLSGFNLEGHLPVLDFKNAGLEVTHLYTSWDLAEPDGFYGSVLWRRVTFYNVGLMYSVFYVFVEKIDNDDEKEWCILAASFATYRWMANLEKKCRSQTKCTKNVAKNKSCSFRWNVAHYSTSRLNVVKKKICSIDPYMFWNRRVIRQTTAKYNQFLRAKAATAFIAS